MARRYRFGENVAERKFDWLPAIIAMVIIAGQIVLWTAYYFWTHTP